jgi:hypothetical protein
MGGTTLGLLKHQINTQPLGDTIGGKYGSQRSGECDGMGLSNVGYKHHIKTPEEVEEEIVQRILDRDKAHFRNRHRKKPKKADFEKTQTQFYKTQVETEGVFYPRLKGQKKFRKGPWKSPYTFENYNAEMLAKQKVIEVEIDQEVLSKGGARQEESSSGIGGYNSAQKFNMGSLLGSDSPEIDPARSVVDKNLRGNLMKPVKQQQSLKPLGQEQSLGAKKNYKRSNFVRGASMIDKDIMSGISDEEISKPQRPSETQPSNGNFFSSLIKPAMMRNRKMSTGNPTIGNVLLNCFLHLPLAGSKGDTPKKVNPFSKIMKDVFRATPRGSGRLLGTNFPRKFQDSLTSLDSHKAMDRTSGFIETGRQDAPKSIFQQRNRSVCVSDNLIQDPIAGNA